MAALVEWHPDHDSARRAVAGVIRLPAHVVIETIAVLTRLPSGVGIDPRSAVEVVRESFPGEPLTLSTPAFNDLLDTVAAAGIRGGAIYDAVVAATSLAAGSTLVSRDRRAERVYRAVGVDVEFVD